MIKIVYWSGTGNTEKMATSIEKGLLEGGCEVDMEHVSKVKMSETLEAEILVLGCSAMGVEELEEDEMAPFVEGLLPQIKGKRIALFGSYGWGNGEWMNNWCEQMKSAGAEVVQEPLIINEFTSGQDDDICREYGKKLSNT